MELGQVGAFAFMDDSLQESSLLLQQIRNTLTCERRMMRYLRR